MNFRRFAAFLIVTALMLSFWGYMLVSSVDAHSAAGSTFYKSEHVEAAELRRQRAYLGGINTSSGAYRQMLISEQQAIRKADGKYLMIAGGAVLLLGLGFGVSASKPALSPPDARGMR
jgi:hypothetical protein